MTRRGLLGAAAAAPIGVLVGCASIVPAVEAVTAAASDVASSTTLWGIAKGIGLAALTAAELADPALATVVATINGLIKAGSSAATAGVTTLAQTQQLAATAQSLTIAAAPYVKVQGHA